ncbi:MAG: YggS family pyridoxal phosphate enzyme [Ilumatobacteraceae bacterium]
MGSADDLAGPTAQDVVQRLAALRTELASIDRRWEHPVAVVAVTKGFDRRAVDAAAEAGCSAIGENYAQELLSKREAVEGHGLDVHFIGRLQSNKVRQIAGVVGRWSSLDRASVIDEVARRAPGGRVLIQVNATDESGKGGCLPDEVAALVARATARGLVVEGLMTVGPTGEPPEAARPGFAVVRSLVDELGLEVCSMGMTSDLAVALEEGSSEVRVGTALFGPRPRRG